MLLSNQMHYDRPYQTLSRWRSWRRKIYFQPNAYDRFLDQEIQDVRCFKPDTKLYNVYDQSYQTVYM